MEPDKKTIIAWRRFLASPEGSAGMLYLRERVPSIQPGESHNIIFSAGKVEGYKNAVDTVSELLTLRSATENVEIENK